MVTGHADVPRDTLINLSMHRRSICQKRFIFQPARPTFPRSAFLPYSRPSKNNGTKCSMLDGREKKECIGGNCRFEQTSASWLSLLVHCELIRKNDMVHFQFEYPKMVWFVGLSNFSSENVDDHSIFLLFFFFFFDERYLWKTLQREVILR